MALPLQVVHTLCPGVYKMNITYIEVLGASGLKIANPGCLFCVSSDSFQGQTPQKIGHPGWAPAAHPRPDRTFVSQAGSPFGLGK